MKKNIIFRALLIAGFGFLSVSAMAQNSGQQGPVNQQEMEARQTEQLTKQLNLSVEQVAKLGEINKTSRETMISLRNDESIDRQAKMEKMKSLRTEREAAIKAILTEEQAQKFEAIQQNRQSRERQPQGRRRGAN